MIISRIRCLESKQNSLACVLMQSAVSQLLITGHCRWFGVLNLNYFYIIDFNFVFRSRDKFIRRTSKCSAAKLKTT